MSDTLYLISHEMVDVWDRIRTCTVRGFLKDRNQNDVALVTVDPPVPRGWAYLDRPTDRFVLHARHVGDSIVSVPNDKSIWVNVLVVNDPDLELQAGFHPAALSIVVWAEIARHPSLLH